MEAQGRAEGHTDRLVPGGEGFETFAGTRMRGDEDRETGGALGRHDPVQKRGQPLGPSSPRAMGRHEQVPAPSQTPFCDTIEASI